MDDLEFQKQVEEIIKTKEAQIQELDMRIRNLEHEQDVLIQDVKDLERQLRNIDGPMEFDNQPFL